MARKDFHYISGSGDVEIGVEDGVLVTYVSGVKQPLGGSSTTATGVPTVINVKDAPYSAAGDGTTDDTAALQAALNVSTSSKPVTIYIPNGTYKITSALVVPFAPGTKIIGENMLGTIIQQFTAGQPVLKFTTNNTHSVKVAEMTLTYNAAQTNTASINVYYDWGSGGTSFAHVYERLLIQNGYRGFALNDGNGSQSLWDTTWREIRFSAILDRCISLVPAVSVGMLCNRMEQIYVQNTGTGIVSTGPAFYLDAPLETQMENIDVEGWYNDVFHVSSGGGVYVDCFHLENHTFSAVNAQMAYVTSGWLAIRNATFAAVNTAANTGTLRLFNPDTNSQITLEDATLNIDGSHGTPGYVEVAAMGGITSGATMFFRNVTKTGGTMPVPGTSSNWGPSTTGSAIIGGVRDLTYGATVATDLSQPSRKFRIAATNTTAFTISNPTNPVIGDEIIYDIKNSSGGVMGAITWGNQFLLAGASFTNPANGKRRVIKFYWDGTNWVESFRASADT